MRMTSMTRTPMTLTTFPIVIQSSGVRISMLVDPESPPHPLSLLRHRRPFNRGVALSPTSIPSSLSPLEQFLRMTMLSLGIAFGRMNFWRCTVQEKLSNYQEKSCRSILNLTSKPKGEPSAQYGARSQVDLNPPQNIRLTGTVTAQGAEIRCPCLLCNLKGRGGGLKWNGKIVG